MLSKVIDKLKAFSNYLGNNCFLNIENNDDIKIDKKIVIYTLAWGNYLDLYFTYTFPSIIHESNISRLQNEGYSISFVLYTIDDKNKVKNKFKKQIESANSYKFEIVNFKKDDERKSIIANTSIVNVINYCIAQNAILFMAPPDTIFANSSVYNSIVLSYSKRKSFASAHPRIDTNILSKYKEFPKEGFNSTELVGFSLKNSHPNFKFANEESFFNTIHAGVSYRKISETLFIITSNMPTTYVVIPHLEDVNFFKKSGNFNDWDRGWLDLLLKKNRLKVCGSSDIFFCAEITFNNSSTTVKPKMVKNLWKDLYGKSFSNRICNVFISTWRR